MTIAAIAGTPVVDEISARDPDLVSPGGTRTWSMRGRNFVMPVTVLEPGDRLTEHDLPEEYALLVQGDAPVSVEHGSQGPVSVSEPAFAVVPAGTSTVRASSSTTVTRVFTARCAEQMGRAVNHAAGTDPRTAPLPRTTQAGGDRIRIHRLRDVPDGDGRLGRIFRTSSTSTPTSPDARGARETVGARSAEGTPVAARARPRASRG